MNSDRGHDAELSQKLLEWMYGLLDEAESAKLRQRIDTDPAVARLHAELLRNKDILSSAVRHPGKPIDFRGARPAAAHPLRRRRLQIANILLTLSASVLLVAGLTGYQFVQIHRNSLEENTIVVDIAGPPKLVEGFENQFEVVTRNLKREPIATEVAFQFVSAQGTDLFSKKVQSGPDGRAFFSAPRSLRSSEVTQLAIMAQSPRSQSTLVQAVAAESPNRAAYLTTDRISYRPGDELFFRAVLLECLGLEPVNQMPVRFELYSTAGDAVADPMTTPTELGVAAGSFPLPADLRKGEYRLSARTDANEADRVVRSLHVRGTEPVRFKKQIEFDRASYAPGDQVSARFRAERITGEPANGIRARAEVVVQGRTVLRREFKTDDKGEFPLAFPVPADNDVGPSFLGVQLEDDTSSETYRRDLPLAQNGVDLRFFPEGGALVANLANRVYFQAVGPRDEPIHVEGKIRSAGNDVADFATTRDGLGSFVITPSSPSETYEVQLSTPPLPGATPTFPKVSDKTVLLQASPGVVEAGKPIEMSVRATQPGIPIVISAHCRGIPVAHRLIETGEEMRVTLPVSDEVDGVVRVTAFEAKEQKRLVPVAERLVYRQPLRKLAVSLIAQSPQYKPGANVELVATVTDERGAPVPHAVLGAAVVDRASLVADEDRKRTNLATHFLLWSQIDHPADLENADLLLTDTPEARSSLDLVLGTHGWRTFRPPVASNFAMLDDATPAPPPVESPVYASNDDVVRVIANDYEEATRSILFVAGVALSLLFGGVFLYWLAVLILWQTPLLRAITLGLTASAAAVAGITIYSLRSGDVAQTPTENQAIQQGASDFDMTLDIEDEQRRVLAEQPRRANKQDNLWFFEEAPIKELATQDERGATEKRSLRAVSKERPDEPSKQEIAEDLPLPAANENLAEDSLERAPGDGKPGLTPPPAPLPPSASPSSDDTMKDRFQASRPQIVPAPATGRGQNAIQQKASGGGSSQGIMNQPAVRSYAHTRLRALSSAATPQTLYWNPMLVCDEKGQAKIEFDLTDVPATFDVIVEAHAPGGRLGAGKMQIRTAD